MPELQKNPFLLILCKATENKWCVELYCTTCGAMDFRSALRAVGGELGGPLSDALTDVDLDKLISMPNWEDAIHIALRDLPVPGQATAILESWLDRAHQNIRFFDVVLYRLVRYLPVDHPVRLKWTTKGVALAEKTHDFSLVESLILTLHKNALQHSKLMSIARVFAKESKQMHRVLKNVCRLIRVSHGPIQYVVVCVY